MARGETAPAFEEAAYRLAPGEISPVTETPFGFHVIARPMLANVREEFRAGVQARLVARLDSAYLGDLEQRRGLAVRRTGPGVARRAVARPLLFRLSSTPVAGWDGGRLTAGHVLQWLDVLPPQVAEQISTAGEAELRQFLRSMAREAMLFGEASAAGVELDSAEYRVLRDALAADVVEVRAALGLDSATARASGADPARVAVDAYLDRVVSDPERLVPVPRFLADQLRTEAKVRVYPEGVARAHALASSRRATLDSAAGRLPAVQPGGPLR
jgi:hypothetical protein